MNNPDAVSLLSGPTAQEYSRQQVNRLTEKNLLFFIVLLTGSTPFGGADDFLDFS